MTFRSVSRNEFAAAIEAAPRAAYLSSVSAEGRYFLSEDGLTGFVIANGDLRNVFNAGARGMGAAAVQRALDLGARRLDCYDGFLPAYYARFGFAEVMRVKWDDRYAPADWDYSNGRPDVVIMAQPGAEDEARAAWA